MIIPAFVERCDTYCARKGMSRARLSTILFKDGKRIDAIDGGANVGVLTIESAAKTLTDLESELQAQDAAA